MPGGYGPCLGAWMRDGKVSCTYPPITLLMVCGSQAQVEVNWKISRVGEILYICNPSGGRPKSVCGFLMSIVNRRGNGVNVTDDGHHQWTRTIPSILKVEKFIE